MNCFRSIAVIASELQKQGYTIHGEQLTEDMVKERILLGARNVGSWAPGELDRLIVSKSVIKLPVSEYKEWFATLPLDFQARVVEQWGEPEVSYIMIKDGSFIIPRINVGNLMVLPQPARGFGENPEKLYHDPKIYPHHQYIAFYLWLKKKFKADAVISLGKHGNQVWGKSLKSGYQSNLEDVKMTMHTSSSNLYNILDNDDMFAFLGGLSLAVKHQTGSFPDTVVANMKDGKTVTLEDLPKAIGKALRTRYLNPKWIRGMKQEVYSGAKAMDEFVEYLWGFQVTSPWAVNKTHWEEIHDVYIQDKYGQDLKQFFYKNNSWALQSISARMLEADRKGYWKPPANMKKNIARTFAVNVIEKGVACCEHTCNNPMFQNYVTNFLSLSGLLTPKQMDAFKMALAKATGKTLEEQKNDYKQARQNLEKVIEKTQKVENAQAKTHGESIEGFEMVEEKAKETTITSSGSAWQVMVIVAGMLVLLFAGYKRIKV